MLNEQNKILFPELEEDNIYRNYAPHEREIVFHFFFSRKQPIKNKPYFYKTFPLIKDSFPYHRVPLVRQSLHKYKYLWSMWGKNWSSNLQNGVSHTYTLKLPKQNFYLVLKKIIKKKRQFSIDQFFLMLPNTEKCEKLSL